MKLWMSGTVGADVGPAFDATVLDIEKAVNTELGGNDYGSGLREWQVLHMVAPPSQLGKEIAEYDSKTGTANFRLRVDHRRFKKSDAARQRAIIFEALERSLLLFESAGVRDVNTVQLHRDLREVGRRHGWCEPLTSESKTEKHEKLPPTKPLALTHDGPRDRVELYKDEGARSVYWIGWVSGRQIVIQQGIAGESGIRKVLKAGLFQNPRKLLERESMPLLQQGFVDRTSGNRTQLILQYRVQDMGDEADLRKAKALQRLLGEALETTGLGHCDGHDLGSGTLNIFFLTFEETLSTKVITETLKKEGLERGARLAVKRPADSEYQLLWPSHFQKPLDLNA